MLHPTILILTIALSMPPGNIKGQYVSPLVAKILSTKQSHHIKCTLNIQYDKHLKTCDWFLTQKEILDYRVNKANKTLTELVHDATHIFTCTVNTGLLAVKEEVFSPQHGLFGSGRGSFQSAAWFVGSGRGSFSPQLGLLAVEEEVFSPQHWVSNFSD